MFYVYILRSQKDNNLYIGYTSDLKKRFTEHNDGKVRSTKSRVPFELVYYESYKAKGDVKERKATERTRAGSRRIEKTYEAEPFSKAKLVRGWIKKPRAKSWKQAAR